MANRKYFDIGIYSDRVGLSLLQQRRSAHNALHMKQAVKYTPYQYLESKQLVYDLIQKPQNLKEHFRRFSSSMITSVIFG